MKDVRILKPCVVVEWRHSQKLTATRLVPGDVARIGHGSAGFRAELEPDLQPTIENPFCDASLLRLEAGTYELIESEE